VEGENETQNSNSPNPKLNGAKKIILTFDAPERWYADNIHALKTISSVIGAWFFFVYVSICGEEWRGGGGKRWKGKEGDGKEKAKTKQKKKAKDPILTTT
jgi:hypothetical protein